MKRLLISFICFYFICGCNKNGKDLPEYIVWEFDIPSIDSFNSIYDPIIFSGKVIIPDDGGGVLLCLDKETSEELWRWTDARGEYGDFADGFSYSSYIYDDILIVGDRNLLYGIDVNNGETIWHRKGELSGGPFIKGAKDKFVSFEQIFEEKIWINIGDIHTGEIISIYEFERDDQYPVASNLPLIFEYEGITYITFTKIKFGFNEQNEYFEDQWLHLYNVTEAKLEWISDTIPLEYNVSGIAGLRPVFEDGQILLANDAIYSYNIEDGSLEWKKYYGNSFVLGTHLSAAEGRVYGNNASGFMVSLNVHTGAEYFNVETGSSASRIEINDGKVYIASLTGSGPNSLEVRDAYTGQLLRRMQAPYHNNSNGRYFDEVITVDPETGYIYTADHELILCIDPEV